MNDDEARVLRDSVKHELRSITPSLRNTVAKEIRACALFGEPLSYHANPPRDIEAERSVLAALWEGYPMPPWLEARHFYDRGYSDLYAILSTMIAEQVEPTVDRILVAQGWALTIEAAAFSRGAARDEITRIANETPVTLVEPAARRVVALYHRRQALDAVLRAEALLRLDVTGDRDEVVELLRQAAGECNEMRDGQSASAAVEGT